MSIKNSYEIVVILLENDYVRFMTLSGLLLSRYWAYSTIMVKSLCAPSKFQINP
jgi:hypothetical protein